MKAARFYEKHKLVIEDVPIRELEEDEVLVKVYYCGVCGTDVHIFEGDKGSAEVVPPRILGHELSGQVVKTGNKAKKIKIGDRVSIDPNDCCDMCYFCADGKKHLCKEMTGIGTAADGGFAEYIIARERLVYRIPDSMPYKTAAMIEPVSCCLHGIELTKIEPGDTVMIVGTGNIGLIMVQMAKHMGASTVIAVEPSEKRRKKAGAYGADILIDPGVDNTDEILEEYKVENIDKVIDCAGRMNTAQYALHHAGKGAVVMLFGLTAPDDAVKIYPFELFKKELTIKTSFVNPYAFRKSIALLEKGIINVEDIITDVIELDDIEKVFKKKLYNRDGKVLIQAAKEENQ